MGRIVALVPERRDSGLALPLLLRVGTLKLPTRHPIPSSLRRLNEAQVTVWARCLALLGCSFGFTDAVFASNPSGLIPNDAHA